MGIIHLKNKSRIEPIHMTGKVIRGKRADIRICQQDKDLFIVTYTYRELDTEQYDYDTIIIKAYDTMYVYKYMNKFRQEFIACGYEMQYSLEKVSEDNFVEV